MKKYYELLRNKHTNMIISPRGRSVHLKESLKHVNHSPTGYEWGYMGSGPSQAAFAILLDYTQSVSLAKEGYMMFKEKFLAGLSDVEKVQEISVEEIEKFLKEYRL